MASHVRRIKFCNLRRLNSLTAKNPTDGTFDLWSHLDSNWYEFSGLNIFLGENGAGKSTVLDLLGVLHSPTRLAGLARENRYSESKAVFVVETSNGRRVKGEMEALGHKFHKAASHLKNVDGRSTRTFTLAIHRLDEFGSWMSASNKFIENIDCSEIDNHTQIALQDRIDLLECPIFYYKGPADNWNSVEAAAVLNDAKHYLPGVLGGHDANGYVRTNLRKESTFVGLHGAEIGVYLSDDDAQYNNVAYSNLPSGWRQLTGILHWLKNVVEEGSVCLLEEPEDHLHPHLQRYLARKVSEIIEEKSLQLFVTTHSNVLQNSLTWRELANDDIRYFEATGDRLECVPDFSRLLDRLGYLNSDMHQSNGVIWVEGPSDRIYIKHWLAMWCEANGKRAPVEHIEYSFCFYGGAILAHFEVGDDPTDSDEFVKLITQNRNFAVVLDSDHDYTYSAAGELTCLNSNSHKRRIVDGLKTRGCRAMSWVTHGYTIENYLPDEILERFFDTRVDGGLDSKSKTSKVQIAARVTNSATDMLVSPYMKSKLMERVSLLYKTINLWNYNTLDLK